MEQGQDEAFHFAHDTPADVQRGHEGIDVEEATVSARPSDGGMC